MRTPYTTSELKLIKQVYPLEGTIGCHKLMPHHSIGSLRFFAWQNNIKMDKAILSKSRAMRVPSLNIARLGK